jgi:hypothetical protein
MVQIDYPSEPVLAEAARITMQDEEIYKDCIRFLMKSFSNNVLQDIGEVGELVAKIIMLQCVDKARDTDQATTVRKFLEQLTNEDIKVQMPVQMPVETNSAEKKPERKATYNDFTKIRMIFLSCVLFLCFFFFLLFLRFILCRAHN